MGYHRTVESEESVKIPRPGSAGLTFAVVLRQHMEKRGIHEQELADRAGISRPHLRKILLEGTEPRWKLARKLLKTVGAPITVLEQLEEDRQDPEEILKDLLALINDELGIPKKTANAAILNQIGSREPALVKDFQEFAFRLLQPFSSARKTWGAEDLSKIRSALIGFFDTLVESAESDGDSDAVGADTKRSLIAEAVSSAFLGQKAALEEPSNFNDGKHRFPSLAVNSSTYLKIHQAATELLCGSESAASGRFILGVTGLLPSLWFNSPPGKGTDVDDLYIGTERKEATAYREMVENLISKKQLDLSVARLVLAAESHDDKFLQCGIYKEKDHLAAQARLYIVEHSEYGDKLSQAQYQEGVSRAKKRFSRLNPPNFPSWRQPETDRAYLLIDSVYWLNRGESISDEAIDLGSGWRATRFLTKFIDSLHSKPDLGRFHCLSSDSTHGFVDGRRVTITEYLEQVGPIFDLWLFGSLNDPDPSHGCKWLFGLAGEVYWTSDIARLRLLTDHGLVKYIAEFWYSIWNQHPDGAERLGNINPWNVVQGNE